MSDDWRLKFWADDDGIVHIRNSERGTLDRCPTQWWWSWREGLRPKETSKPLWFGTGWHLAMATYYGEGKKRRFDEAMDLWRQYADESADFVRVKGVGLDEDQFVEARTLGEVMLQGYHDTYAGDKDWDVISTEQTFELRIPLLPAVRSTSLWDNKQMQKWARVNLPDYFILNGTFDGVYRDKDDRKRTKLMEHKTAGTISMGHLPMDNQAGTYWMVAQSVGRSQGWLGKSENISEITYNFVRKALPDDRPKDAEGYATNKPVKAHYQDALRARGYQGRDIDKATLPQLMEYAQKSGIVVTGDRSKRQPPPLFVRHPVRKTAGQRRSQLSRLQSEVVRMFMIVDGVLDVTKAPSRDHCGFCSFKEMCESHEAGSGWKSLRRALYVSSDQYVDHKSSGGA